MRVPSPTATLTGASSHRQPPCDQRFPAARRRYHAGFPTTQTASSLRGLFPGIQRLPAAGPVAGGGALGSLATTYPTGCLFQLAVYQCGQAALRSTGRTWRAREVDVNFFYTSLDATGQPSGAVSLLDGWDLSTSPPPPRSSPTRATPHITHTGTQPLRHYTLWKPHLQHLRAEPKTRCGLRGWGPRSGLPQESKLPNFESRFQDPSKRPPFHALRV